MKRKRKKIIAFLFSFVLSLSFCEAALAAGNDMTDILINVTYGQTEARNMLKLINDFRTGDQAWCWDEESQNKVYEEGLAELIYDYDLEQIAMQRAAELAVSYAHARPNSTDDKSCLALAYNGTTSAAENIGAGYASAQKAFEAWQETSKDYGGQGHRRTMLDARYQAIGIGYAIYDGCEFWVQEFGLSVSNPTSTEPKNASENVKVEVLNSKLTTAVSVQEKTKEMSYGTVEKAPAVMLTYGVEGRLDRVSGVADTITPEWEAVNSAIAVVKNGEITANGAGDTILRANVAGEMIEIILTVKPMSIEGAEVILASEEYSYEGEDKPIMPEATIVVAGKTLDTGTDYVLTYEENNKIGTAKLTVTGKGNYTGTLERTFKIVCNHSFGEEEILKQATCQAEGKKERKCLLCNEIETEIISKVPHTPIEDKEEEATCTKDGKTSGSHCSVCGEVLKKQETVPKTGHIWDDGKITKNPTYKETGVKTFYCKNCGIRGTIILDKLEYHITKGADSIWTKGADGGLTIVSDGDAGRLVSVLVDGKVVDKKYYEVKSDNTTVTLKPEYLDSLNAGKHTYSVKYEDGSVTTTFTVKENTTAAVQVDKKKTNTVKTGDTASTALLITLMVLALCGAAVSVKMKKKG